MIAAKHLSCEASDCPYGGEPKDRRGWHLDRSLNLGYILTAVIMACGFTAWAMVQERRITTVEVGLKTEHDVNTAQEASRIRSEDQGDLWRQRVEAKIDRLMETLATSGTLARHDRSKVSGRGEK